MKKDALARGARSATFAGGFGKTDIFKNASKEPRIPVVPKVKALAKTKRVFTPLGDWLLIRRSEVKSESNLVLDMMEKEQPAEGLVLRIGPSVETVIAGEVVSFGRYSGAVITLNGENLLLMRIDEIQGVITEEN
jgi:chaperonin GroES